MPPSEARAAARLSWVVVVACIVAAALLLPTQVPRPRSFLLLFAAIGAVAGALVALVIALVSEGQADRHDALVGGEGKLVEWLVDEAEWRRFRTLDAAETNTHRGAARWGFGLISLLFVLAAIGVLVDDAGAWELSVVFGVIAVGMWGMGEWLERSSHAFATRDELPSPAVIGRDGLAFRGRFVPFRGFGIAFSGATFEADQHLLRIRYVVSGGDASAEHQVRVPVPSGREEEARKVVETLHS